MHAGIYVGNNLVVDSGSKPFVSEIAIEDFLDVSSIAIYRLKDCSEKDLRCAINFCLQSIGKPFNYHFDLNNDRSFYCTQLIARALRQTDNPVVLKQTMFLGKPFLLASSIEQSDRVELVLKIQKNFLQNIFNHSPSILIIVGSCFFTRAVNHTAQSTLIGLITGFSLVLTMALFYEMIAKIEKNDARKTYNDSRRSIRL